MPTTQIASTRRRFFRQGMELGGGLAAVPALAVPAPPPGNEVLKTIHSLHSTHGDFSDRPVPDAQVETVLDAAVRAANASNMQSYSILVSRDPAKIQKLTTYSANCMLLFCADYTRLLDVAAHLGHQFHADNMDAFVTASTNAILAAQTAVVAARSMGIDSLLTNGIHRGDIERHWAILGLPQNSCFPLIALLLGYARTEPSHRMGRLRGPGVVHYESYHRASKEQLEALVVRHDDPAENLALNDTWRAKGYKHYLDWFYKEWVTGRKPATAEGPMLKRLRKSGFIDSQSA
jgi:nitroreductase